MQPFSPGYSYALMREQKTIRQAWNETRKDSGDRMNNQPGWASRQTPKVRLTALGRWVKPKEKMLPEARTVEESIG